jgi:hypothetical protein
VSGSGVAGSQSDWTIDVDVLRHVVSNELKILIAKVSDVGEVAGDQVIDANDGVTALQQRFREM